MTKLALKLVIIVCHLFFSIQCLTELNWHFCETYCCSCVIRGAVGNGPTSGCDFGQQVTKGWETLFYNVLSTN